MIDSLMALRAFVRVVDRGGFSAAARSLALSTAMVSKHIASLEAQLGVRLLDRNTRHTAPTEAGRLFYERCTDLLEQLEEVETELMSSTREVHGTLRVSMPPELGCQYMTPLLARFQQRHPLVQLHLTLHNRMADLVEDGLDAAVRFMRHNDQALPGRQIACTHLYLVASPTYLRHHGRPCTPADVREHAGVCFGNPQPWQQFSFQHRGEAGVIELRPSLVISSSDMVCKAAEQGLGLAVVTTMDAGPALRERRLVRLLPNHDLGSMGMYLVYPHRRHVPAKVRALRDLLLEAFGPVPTHDPFLHEPKVSA